jgi:hypothetical protein
MAAVPAAVCARSDAAGSSAVAKAAAHSVVAIVLRGLATISLYPDPRGV